MRIAVMVSGGGTNLQALLDAQDSGGLGGGEITLVISSRRDAYALERAAKRGIQTIVLRKRDFAGESALDAAMLEALRAKGIGLIALAGYLSMLGPAVLGEFGGRILNVHPSLIPSFCGKGFYGLRVHQAALEYGVKITGATVHFVNEVYDGGRIVLQKAVEVLPGDTPESLQQRVMREAEWQIFPQAVGMFCKGEIRA